MVLVNGAAVVKLEGLKSSFFPAKNQMPFLEEAVVYTALLEKAEEIKSDGKALTAMIRFKLR